MDRRETLKLLLLGGLGSELSRSTAGASSQADPQAFSSAWHEWPDMRWAGPEYWGNRLQDWSVGDGVLECRRRAPNRALHCLTRRLTPTGNDFTTDVVVDLPRGGNVGYTGFRVGAKGPYADSRSAAVFGEGLDAGMTTSGRLFLNNDMRGTNDIEVEGPVRLTLDAKRTGGDYELDLTARAVPSERVLARAVPTRVSSDELTGNVALVSHYDTETDGSGPAFSHWRMAGSKLATDDGAAFGPIVFTQYSLHRSILKLTAQLAPVEAIAGVEATLELESGGVWSPVARSDIDTLSRTAAFRVEPWEHDRDVPFRVRVSLPVGGEPREFFYAGTIAKEPDPSEPLRVAVLSCNADHGFPDAEVVEHASQHQAHLAVFLGDQFYESTGGFGIQTSPIEDAALDVLHKWMMFGWSYRELFRHIPNATIPDDHDVYHGNIWGEAGKRAPTDEGWGYVAQDQGGFKMPPAWVNAVQRMQTSHLPDAFDPTPVGQGIGVYYTQWDYGGVSFAVLEDRKFKSAPKNVLPPDARVQNGWIQNPAFDIRDHRDVPGAELLGERQMRFLDVWSRDWSGGSTMKAVLSQTNFAAVHTIPESAMIDEVIPELPMPEPGDYVGGDKPAVDLDSNGWPQNERDAVLRVMKRCAAFHIAGDQHLATLVRHGIDAFDDATYTFTGPALNNIWPRRWWPPVAIREAPLPSAPDYCGRFYDGFGNRITVHAAANPRRTEREPSIIRDRATGYGIVTFDKEAKTVRVECWPRDADPREGNGGQYQGWPITIDMSEA